MIKRVLKTLFPKFGEDELDNASACGSKNPDDQAPDLDELSDCSENSKGKTKEDEDVAVFLSLVDRMSVKSLLFILQMHAKSMHGIDNLDETLDKINLEQQVTILCDEFASGSEADKKKKTKKLRFAEIMGGQKIRAEVREIPHCSTFTQEDKDLMWWSKDEMKATRSQCIRVVRYYKAHCPHYEDSMNTLAHSYEEDADEIMVEHHMKKLAQESSTPRGLEVHICGLLSQIREESVQNVLVEQEKIKAEIEREQKRAKSLPPKAVPAKSPKAPWRRKIISASVTSEDIPEINPAPKTDEQINEEWERIRAASLTASQPCHTLAFKLAECDHIEALKASISPWRSMRPARA